MPQHLRRKFRCSFATHTYELLCTTPSDTAKAAWVKARWSTSGSQQNHQGSTTTLKTPHLPRQQWKTFNHLRTEVGCLRAAMQKWGALHSTHCEYRDPLQTMEHIITSCPKHWPLNGNRGLIDLDDETLNWLASTELKV
ncbi:hypothetical protein ABVT39_006078 [Epinephelus coioides]